MLTTRHMAVEVEVIKWFILVALAVIMMLALATALAAAEPNPLPEPLPGDIGLRAGALNLGFSATSFARRGVCRLP